MRRPNLVLGGPWIVLLAVLAVAPASAQQQDGQEAGRKPLTIDDYARWRTIEGARISADGRWVAYTLRHANSLPADQKPALHVYDHETGETVQLPRAHDGEFSPDGRWLVYQVDSVPAARGRGQGEAAEGEDADSVAPAAQPARTELRELATGGTWSWRSAQSAEFNAASTHLLLRLRAQGAEGGRGGSGGGGGGGGRGGGAGGGGEGAGDALLHDLATGASQLIGSVGDTRFNRQGDLLAYAIEQPVRDANGLIVMELASRRLTVLENDTLIYGRIRWSEDGDRLAALKGRPEERMRERDNRLVSYAGVRQTARSEGAPVRAVLDRGAQGFPEGFVISERTALSWSDDGRRVFFGIIPQTPSPDTARRASRDSVANVDVWRTQDQRIQSQQMIEADRDRDFTFTQAFDVAEGRFIALADSTMRTLQVADEGPWAVGFDPRGYIADTARARADVYRVNTETGERTLMFRGLLTGQHQFGITPDGERFLFWRDQRYQAYDLAAGTTRTLPGGEDGSFTDMEWDRVGPRPAYGVEGYAKDGSGVIVRQRYDLWLLPFGGGDARSLTGGVGAEEEVRFRWVRTEPVDSAAPRRTRSGREIDLARPLTLAAYGQWTKRSGFYRLAGGRLQPLVFEDASYGTPVRAEKAERFLLARQTFTEFPDLRLSGPAFSDHTKISDANPQQAEYVWGRRVLFDYENGDGVRLQGILALPDDYAPGERRPMLVSFYEKNSQNLHQYPTPNFITGMGAVPHAEALGRGYVTMVADVHYRTGSSHSDQLESVEAATRKVIELGYADPARIGVHGHSYGGEGAAYIGVRSKMFAAVGMGAGVTDITADFNQNWGWSYQVQGGSGQNGSNYYLFGQGRWGTDPWRSPELYRNESAITHVGEAVAPILIMHGTADPTVSFSEGMNFYNALRYNGKNAVMLAYPEEGHGLRGLANRRDLTERYFDFFDHYLKGTPAARWLSEGVPYLVKAAGNGG